MAVAVALSLVEQAEASDPPTTSPSIAGTSLAVAAGRGASLSFTEYEAEHGLTNGAILGPDRTFGTLASEASGRRAVRLSRVGEEVAFVLDQPANALIVRYAIPDKRDCRAGETEIGVYLDARRVAALPLTPCFAWLYGDYPFSNDAAAGQPHHFYDHSRLLLAEELPRGARVSLRFEAETQAEWLVIDLVDFEQVAAPSSPPPEALSVIDFGADPTGSRPALGAFQKAVGEGQRLQRQVWIPAGVYRIDGHLFVDQVTLMGAGPWRSVLRGRGVGIYGHKAPAGSHGVVLKDFAIIGEVVDRDDGAPLNGVGGALSHSTVSNLFIQHTKVGVWVDGPLENLTLSSLRIFDQMADGVNFHGGVTDSVVEDSLIRNVGDDGLAMWSHPTPNRNNIFRNNTVVAPVLANGIAIYGGRDITVRGNIVADTVTRGGGYHLGARFGATPLEGSIRFENNLAVRTGSIDPVWRFGVGAFWIYALEHAVTEADIELRDTLLLDSTGPAVQVLGEGVEGLRIEDMQVRGGVNLIQIRAPGEATLTGVTAQGLTGPPIDRHEPTFRIQNGGAPVWSTEVE